MFSHPSFFSMSEKEQKDGLPHNSKKESGCFESQALDSMLKSREQEMTK
jgi:hypothetical protein